MIKTDSNRNEEFVKKTQSIFRRGIFVTVVPPAVVMTGALLGWLYDLVGNPLSHAVFRASVITGIIGGTLSVIFVRKQFLLLRETFQESIGATRESEERLLQIADTAFDGLAIHQQGIVMEANSSFRRMLGYEPDEVLRGRPISDFIAPQEWTRVGEILQRDPEARYEAMIVKKDGTQLVGAMASKACEYGGKPARIVAVRDLTEAKRAESASRVRIEVAEVLGSSLDYTSTLSKVVRIMARPGFAALADLCELVLVPQEHQGKTAQATVRFSSEGTEGIFHPRELSALEARALFAGVPLQSSEPSSRRLELVVPLLLHGGLQGGLQGSALGALRWVRHTARVRAFDDKDVRLAEDLAERLALAVEHSRLYETAQHSIRIRDEFISIASHELKTPLTSLTLRLETVMELIDAFPSRREQMLPMFQAALSQAERLGWLINDLLDVSRMHSGRLELNRERLELGEVIRGVLERSTESARVAGCELSAEIEGGVFGKWDRIRIEQVVLNLLGNAFKYGASAPVEIRLSRAGKGPNPEAVLAIRDFGIGIAPKDHSRIFGRFERAVSDQNFGGLGLGLYIAQQIIVGHGGSIEVQSEPGNGACFTVRLPLSAEAEEMAGAKASTSSPSLSPVAHLD